MLAGRTTKDDFNQKPLGSEANVVLVEPGRGGGGGGGSHPTSSYRRGVAGEGGQ